MRKTTEDKSNRNFIDKDKKENNDNKELYEFMDQTVVNTLWQMMLSVAQTVPLFRDKLPHPLSYYFDAETLLRQKMNFEREWLANCKVYIFEKEEDFLKNKELLEKILYAPAVFIIRESATKDKKVFFSNNRKVFQSESTLSFSEEAGALLDTPINEKNLGAEFYILSKVTLDQTVYYKNSYIYNPSTKQLLYIDRIGIAQEIAIKNPKEFDKNLIKVFGANSVNSLKPHYWLDANKINLLMREHVVDHSRRHHCLSDMIGNNDRSLLLSEINNAVELSEKELAPDALTRALQDRTLDMITNLILSILKDESTIIQDDYRLLLASVFHPSHWVATIADLKGLDIGRFIALIQDVQNAYTQRITEIINNTGYVIQIEKEKPAIEMMKDDILYIYMDGDQYRFTAKRKIGGAVVVDRQYPANLSEEAKDAIKNNTSSSALSEEIRKQLFNDPSCKANLDDKIQVHKSLLEKYAIKKDMSDKEKKAILSQRIQPNEIKNILKKNLKLNEHPDALLDYFHDISLQFNDSRDPLVPEEYKTAYYDSARLQLRENIRLENHPSSVQKGNTCADITVCNCFYQGLFKQDFLLNQLDAPTSMEWRAIVKKIHEIEISEVMDEIQKKESLDALMPELTKLMIKNYDYNINSYNLIQIKKINQQNKETLEAIQEWFNKLNNNLDRYDEISGQARVDLISNLELLLNNNLNYRRDPSYKVTIVDNFLNLIPSENDTPTKMADYLLSTQLDAIVLADFQAYNVSVIENKMEEAIANIIAKASPNNDLITQYSLLMLMKWKLENIKNNLINGVLNLRGSKKLARRYASKQIGMMAVEMDQVFSSILVQLQNSKNLYVNTKKSLLALEKAEALFNTHLETLSPKKNPSSVKKDQQWRRSSSTFSFWSPNILRRRRRDPGPGLGSRSRSR